MSVEIVDRTDSPMQACPDCMEPLIFTFEKPGFEWHCQVCGGWFPMLRVARVPRDARREARHDELKARYEIDRLVRTVQAGSGLYSIDKLAPIVMRYKAAAENYIRALQDGKLPANQEFDDYRIAVDALCTVFGGGE